jgi:hypothetical protein
VVTEVLAKPVLTFFRMGRHGADGCYCCRTAPVLVRLNRFGSCLHEYRSSTTVRACTRDEGRPFEFGNQILTSSYRKAAAAIICMETPCGIYAARLSRLGAGL